MQAMNHRKCHGILSWVHGHMLMTLMHSFGRVPLPDKGEHVARRGRKATDRSWSLIAGLPKVSQVKGKRLRQFIPGKLA